MFTKRLAFPDGVERLIVLPQRYWEMYDTLDAAWGVSDLYAQGVLERSSEEIAPGAPGFEANLREHLALCIRMGWEVYQEGQWSPSNEQR